MNARKQDVALVKQSPQLSIMNVMQDDDDGITAEDIQIPRVRLLQGMSQSVVDGVGKIGELQDSLSGESLGESIEVAIFKKKTGAIYFEAGEGMKCKSDDGLTSIRGDRCTQCPFGEYWGQWKGDTPPKCAQTHDFMAVTVATLAGTDVRPLVISFSKTSLKVGRRLAQMLAMNKLKGHTYNSTIRLASEKVKNDKGTYAQFTVAKGRDLNQEELIAAEGWASLIKKKKVVIVGDDSMAANPEEDIDI